MLALLVPPATAATPKTTKVTGWKTTKLTFPRNGTWKFSLTVSGPAKRPVSLQVKKGAAWVTVATVKTSAKHVAAFTRKLPTVGSFAYRVVAPRVAGWKAAATAPRAVVVLTPTPPPTPPATLSGTFTGKRCFGNCDGAGPKDILSYTATNVTWKHVGVDPTGDQYVLTGQLSLSWRVDQDPDSKGCQIHASGILPLGVDLFRGKGRIFRDTTVAGHPWAAEFGVSMLPNADPVKRAMIFHTEGVSCPTVATPFDASTLWTTAGGYGPFFTNGLQVASGRVGTVLLTNPRVVTGTTEWPGSSDPQAVTNTFGFSG